MNFNNPSEYHVHLIVETVKAKSVNIAKEDNPRIHVYFTTFVQLRFGTIRLFPSIIQKMQRLISWDQINRKAT